MKTLKDIKHGSYMLECNDKMCCKEERDSEIREVAKKWIEKINLFFEFQSKKDKFKEKYYQGTSAFETDLKEVGKWTEYNLFTQQQDKLLVELKLEREFEDFGDETFLHLHTVKDFIKNIFNLTEENLE